MMTLWTFCSLLRVNLKTQNSANRFEIIGKLAKKRSNLSILRLSFSWASRETARLIVNKNDSCTRTNERVIIESESNGDILLESFYESYNNLTIKSLMMIKFVATMFNKAKFIFKIDDDVFLNIPKLVDLYRKSELGTKEMRGKLFQEIPPIRWSFRFFDIGIKWISPKWIYPADIYPDYLAGMGYIFPSWMSECLYRMSLITPMLHLEDVYVTGILAEKCGFKRTDLQGLFSLKVDPCKHRDNILAMHYIQPEERPYLLQTVTNSEKCF